MRRLPAHHPLSQVLQPYLGADQVKEVALKHLRASRPVFRFSLPGAETGLVGKFFVDHCPASPQDRSLMQEYQNYRAAPALGLTEGAIPRLLGRHPGLRLGLLLEAVPGPDLDHYLAEAALGRGMETCLGKLAKLARLLAFFHTRPQPRQAVSPQPALAYFLKLQGQLQAQGLLSPEDMRFLAQEGRAWQERLASYADHQVLLHGDATPTNFLFPDGVVVAVDLERLWAGDRLFDLSWVAGELRHAWGWRARPFSESEGAIQAFLGEYLQAFPGDAALAKRICALNPFYMALAELRIARNSYLSWEYRRALVEEARGCLVYGRRMS